MSENDDELKPPPPPGGGPPPSELDPSYYRDTFASPAPPGTWYRIWGDHLAELEHWAQDNRRGARNDTVAFWTLKVPAIIASASAGIWAHFNLTTVSVIAGAIASVCVIVDGIHPRGMLRNTHLRAFHDLRMLTSHMTSELRSSSGHRNNVIRKIIRESEPERQRIAAYIRDAETSLKPTDKS